MVGNFFIDRVVPVEPFAPLARFATYAWQNRTARSLEFVSGLRFAAWSVSFYSEDHPQVFPVFGILPFDTQTENHWKEHGTLGICHSGESWCNDIFTRWLPDAERLDYHAADDVPRHEPGRGELHSVSHAGARRSRRSRPVALARKPTQQSARVRRAGRRVFSARRRRSSHWHREANMPGQMDRGLRP